MKKYGLLIVCATLFASCGKHAEYYYLTNTVKQLVPYQLGATERFTDENGKTLTLTVESIEDDWWCISEHPPVITELYFQYRNIKLQSENGSSGIDLTIENWHQDIDLTFRPSRKTVTIGFDASGNLFSRLGDSITVYDSIRIGGQMYYDVVKTQKIHYDYYSGYQLDPLQCYYNKPYGVLQVKENDKVILERLP